MARAPDLRAAVRSIEGPAQAGPAAPGAVPQIGARTRRILPIDLSAIRIDRRLRAIDREAVARLARSMADIGQQSPVTVRPDPDDPALFVLVAGAHRIEAARSLGLPQIEAMVVDAADGEYRLIEIDENLMRADLTTLDRARFLAERKRVYLDIHPDRRRGGDRRSPAAQARDPREHASWAEEASEHISLSPRAVQRAVRIGEGIPDELARELADTPIARREGDLYRLARMSGEDQARALDILRDSGPPPGSLAALFGTAVPVRSRDPLDRIKRLWTALDADAKAAFATWLRDTGWPGGRGQD